MTLQKEFFKDLMEDKKFFSEACKKPYLRIECKDENKCICPTRKKKHFQKHFHRKSSSKKPLRYFRKKDASQYIKKKHNRRFIYKKRGHFARNCPHKSVKAIRLIQYLQHSSLFMGKVLWVRALKGSCRFMAITGMVWMEEIIRYHRCIPKA